MAELFPDFEVLHFDQGLYTSRGRLVFGFEQTIAMINQFHFIKFICVTGNRILLLGICFGPLPIFKPVQATSLSLMGHGRITIDLNLPAPVHFIPTRKNMYKSQDWYPPLTSPDLVLEH